MSHRTIFKSYKFRLKTNKTQAAELLAQADASFSEFRRMVEYKAAWYGRKVIIADRFFASSKVCSGCGCKKAKIKLSERTYICYNCGYEADRDLNAARNLAALGRKAPEVTPTEIGVQRNGSFFQPVVEVGNSLQLKVV